MSRSVRLGFDDLVNHLNDRIPTLIHPESVKQGADGNYHIRGRAYFTSRVEIKPRHKGTAFSSTLTANQYTELFEISSPINKQIQQPQGG